MKSIGQLVKHVQTWNPQAIQTPKSFTYIDIASVNNRTKQIENAQHMLSENAPSRARQIVAANDVLVSTVRPGLNAVALVPESLGGATASTGFTVLRPGSELDPELLFHYVQSSQFVDYLTSRSTGAQYPAVSDKVVKAYPIPDLSIEEQWRIVRNLRSATFLISDSREQMGRKRQLRNNIISTHFADLNYAKGNLEDVADVSSGITKGRKIRPGVSARTVPFMAVSNVQDGHLNLSTVKSIEASETEIQRYRLHRNDLLLTEGGDPDKLGRGTLWQDEIPESIHQNHIFRVRVRDTELIEPQYLMEWLGSEVPRRYFLRSAKQTTGIASINMRQLRAAPVVVPPVEVQRALLSRIRYLDACIKQERERERLSHELYASLQHRAFHGKL